MPITSIATGSAGTTTKEHHAAKFGSGLTQLDYLERMIKEGEMSSVLGEKVGMSALLPLNALLNAVCKTDPETQRIGKEAIHHLIRLNLSTMVLHDRGAPIPLELSDALKLGLIESGECLYTAITETGFAYLYLATLMPNMPKTVRVALHEVECAALQNLAQGLLKVAEDAVGGVDSLHCKVDRDELPEAQRRAMLIGSNMKWVADILYEHIMPEGRNHDQMELCATMFGMAATVLVEGQLYGEAASALMSASKVNALFPDFLHLKESVTQKEAALRFIRYD